MRIDFLIIDNPYDSTQYFAEKFSEALQRHGVRTRLFKIEEDRIFQVVQAIMRDPPDLTCSFSNIAIGDHQPIGDQWRIPHLSMLIDPAIYSLHQMRGDYSLISCVDEGDVAFVKELGFEKVFLLHHGVDRDLAGYEERPFGPVFFGTCTDYEKILAEWEPSMRAILEPAAAKVLSPKGISILQAIVEAGVKDEDLVRYHLELDLFVRAKDRVELIRALDHVHVWGEGPWKELCPNAIVHPAIAFTETLEIIKKSKLLLNSSPRFKQGSHERILTGLACGCAVLTGDNPFVSNNFGDCAEVLTYPYGQWDVARDKAASMDKSLIVNGRDKILGNHTWDHRAKTLISNCEKYF